MSAKASNSAAFSFKITVRIPNRPGNFVRVAKAIASTGADLDIVEMLSDTGPHKTRRVTVFCNSIEHEKETVAAVRELEEVIVDEVVDLTFLRHAGGKMELASTCPLENRHDLSIAYTPGVARPCRVIADDPEQAWNLTIKGNTVAVVSDGTAVLGLGDIGPAAAMPVMEGKCQLFKRFAGVNAFPICVDTKEPEEIIRLVKQLAPTFGGINLEDISAPRCFEIEERLKAELDIPVFHDDQHGTAVVVLAALYNALKITKRKIGEIRAVVCGLGAAGTACAKILFNAGLKNIVGVDRCGAITKDFAQDANPAFRWFAQNTNPHSISGTLKEVLKGADMFLGVSAPGLLSEEDIKSMAPGAIVFAMANPTPEIMPEIARPHVAVMATGRSDYPNQINNVLAFPGIFKGALAARARAISEEMKLAAAGAIAGLVSPEQLNADFIIPSPLDPRVAEAVAEAVRECAIRQGLGSAAPKPAPTFEQLTR